MASDRPPMMFDHVRIVVAPETDALGLGGLEGTVYGQSQPSASGVGPVIGDRGEDYAIHVQLDRGDEAHWFAPHLVEFLDVGAGQEIRIGKRRTVRRPDGRWEELPAD